MFEKVPVGGVLIVLAGGFLLVTTPRLYAEEFTYRDLAAPRVTTPSEAPLIPRAARRLPTLSRAGSFEVPAEEPSTGLIPLALSQGSEAARIFERNQRRVGLITGLFQRMKDAMQEEQELSEQRRREAELAEQRAQEETIRQAREEEAARREEQARRTLTAAARSSVAPSSLPAPASATTGADSRGASGAVDRYVVQPGDSLIVVARKVYGDPTAWKLIKEANGLDDRALIRAGDELKIPPHRAETNRKLTWRQTAAQRAPDEQVLDYSKYEFRLYNIQTGDTLSGIAAKFYGSPAEFLLIERYNAKVLARGLRAGDKLLIPLARSSESEERYQKSREGLFD